MTAVQLATPFAIGGAALMLQSMVLFPMLHTRFGALRRVSQLDSSLLQSRFTTMTPTSPRRCCQVGLVAQLPLILCYPLLLYVRRAHPAAGYALFSVVFSLQQAVTGTSFTSSSLMINEASPRPQIGAVNGAGHTLGSFTRALGPGIGGALWSFSLTAFSRGGQFIPFALVEIVAFATIALYAYRAEP